uniref:PH01B001E05.14 protein n=1 Tax=Phyllostachys edulis TaxID=38705 RepID=L0P406_PHYED|nr:PH01B001E05.14 [Phyllostachys edulis]
MADRYLTVAEAIEWNKTIDREDKNPQEANESSKKKDKKAKRSKNKAKDQKPQVNSSKEVLTGDWPIPSTRPDIVRSELDKLLKAGFIREVDHPEWLANPVMVRKSNGIEANPEKIKAIVQMHPPTTKKEVQKLTGCMVALSHFIARLGEKGLPFFKLLRKYEGFEWLEEANATFEDVKWYLTSAHVLVSPKPEETLIIYLTVTPQAVSAVLVVERENVQRQDVNEVLHGPKERYPQVQKLMYALLMSSRKLQRYFQVHKIIVSSEFPLGVVLQNRDAAGRMAKWSSELGEFDLYFVSQMTIKSQILADFIAEWTNPEPVQDPQYDTHDQWMMYFDESLTLSGSWAGVVLESPTRETLKYANQFDFLATNNMAEYEGLLAGIRATKALGIRRLLVRGDSQLVVNQFGKEY